MLANLILFSSLPIVRSIAIVSVAWIRAELPVGCRGRKGLREEFDAILRDRLWQDTVLERCNPRVILITGSRVQLNDGKGEDT